MPITHTTLRPIVMDVENEPIVKDGEEEYGAELTSIYTSAP